MVAIKRRQDSFNQAARHAEIAEIVLASGNFMTMLRAPD
jgi:hypothetical protein